MRSRLASITGIAMAALAVSTAACGDDGAPGQTYYERNIEPILLQTCASNVAGCHAVNDDDPFGFAAGNFDVTSFENVQKRRDLLRPFGPYSVPVLLIKATASGGGDLQFAYGGEFHEIEVQHAGGPNMRVGSEAYLTLLNWMENGATENGLPPPDPPQTGDGNCSTALPSGFDPEPYRSHAEFARFKSDIEPILENCNSGNCHGAPQSDFFISCGTDDDQIAFNFSQAQAFVDSEVDNSQILQVPLAVSSGGYGHTGGEHFASRGDTDYQAIAEWAAAVGPITFGEGDPGKTFFAEHVQPVLLQRGCSFEACHSPSAANDLKLRSGSQGFFSAIALERNYELLRDDFLAVEMPDARRGRAVAKTILPQFGGIPHRGGAVLETPGSGGADPGACPAPFDPDFSAFCTVQEWIRIERQQLLAAGMVSPLAAGDTVPIVYVERAESHVASPLEFDTYQPGSDLLVAQATLTAEGRFSSVGAPVSLLDTCPGAGDRGAVDVRAPDVRFDGQTIAFAMRTAASDPLGIYTVDIAGAGCQRITPAAPAQSGIAAHNFDPAWSPDGAWIVFASSAGGPDGPALSRKLFLPQADIWRMRADGSDREQLTFLTNSELSPQMMREGRIIMTTEKISEGFYQLAGRRLNWDLTDYHPLLAQRAQSALGNPDDPAAMLPSIGYQQATEIREGFDGDFVLILSDAGARGGAGTLGIFNRSIGPFEQGRDDPGYLASLTIPDRAATGRVGSATTGAYRSPYSLPDGRIMASYAGYQGDLAQASSLAWDIVAVSPRTGAREVLIGGPGAQVEAVLAHKYLPREPYYNRRQLVFGGAVDPGITGGMEQAVIHFPDAPQIFTLLTANLRRGRPSQLYRDAEYLAAYVEQPAPPGTSSGSGADGIYQNRTYVGRTALADDGSAKIRAPAGTPLILELQDGDGNPIVTMGEEHQVGPAEVISMGIREDLFDAVCGGCHGSVSGQEIDVSITPDALTGASESLSLERSPATLE